MSIKTLGLEFSTQSAKAVVLDSDAGVVYKALSTMMIHLKIDTQYQAES